MDRLSVACAHSQTTVSEIARRLGVSRAYLSHLKQGRNPAIHQWIRIAEILQVDPDWLRLGTPEKAPHWALPAPAPQPPAPPSDTLPGTRPAAPITGHLTAPADPVARALATAAEAHANDQRMRAAIEAQNRDQAKRIAELENELKAQRHRIAELEAQAKTPENRWQTALAKGEATLIEAEIAAPEPEEAETEKPPESADL